MATTNPLSYNQYVTQLGILAVLQTQTVGGVVQGVDSYFTSLIPQALNYAELRIARDIDLLPSRTFNQYALQANTNIKSIPTGDFVTISSILVTLPDGSKQPILPATQEFIQNVYNSSASNGPPQYFAMVGGDAATGGATSNNILFGPTADTAYVLTVWGTVRLPSLYTYANAGQAANTYTFISTWLPDLLLQASMIYISEMQRNFGAMSNDPEMPGSYEAQYQTLLKGALVESTRSKFWGSGWSSQPPAPIATPGR